MSNKNSMEITHLYKFLMAVKENPGITITRIFYKCNISYSTILKYKTILVPSGFCKVTSANRQSSSIEITHDGELLLVFVERIMKHTEGGIITA